MTRNGIRRKNKKVEAIVNMTPQNNKKEVRVSIGLVNYYRDMCYRRSHLLHPLTSLKLNKVVFKFTDIGQKLVDDIKRAFAHDTLLALSKIQLKVGIIYILNIYLCTNTLY